MIKSATVQRRDKPFPQCERLSPLFIYENACIDEICVATAWLHIACVIAYSELHHTNERTGKIIFHVKPGRETDVATVYAT